MTIRTSRFYLFMVFVSAVSAQTVLLIATHQVSASTPPISPLAWYRLGDADASPVNGVDILTTINSAGSYPNMAGSTEKPVYSNIVPGASIYDPISDTTQSNGWSLRSEGDQNRERVSVGSRTIPGAFTYEAFVRFDDASSQGYFGYHQASVVGGWRMRRLSDGRVRAELNGPNSAGLLLTVDSNVSIPANEWHHVALVFDGATASGNDTHLFIDQALVGSGNYGGTSFGGGSTSFYGGNADPNNANHSVRVDEMRYFDQALGPYGFLQVDATARLVIDRQSGAMSLRGAPDEATGILGYTITSSLGALDQTGWRPIAVHYDAPPGGNGSVDSDDAWTILTAAGVHTDLSETLLTGGNGGNLTTGTSVNLGNSAWIRNLQEDIQMKLLLSNGTLMTVPVSFTGGTGRPHRRSDLDFDAGLDRDDWTIFMAGASMGLAGLSPAEAYQKGDLNYDGFQDGLDLALFKADFDALNGLGVFDTIVNPLPGDYNNNGIVDAADFVIWRNSVGVSITMFNETVSPGVVDAADYAEWRSYFGTTSGSGAAIATAVAIPEPTCLMLAGLIVLFTGRRNCPFRRKN